MPKILINTRTSGKFSNETINGRKHIVTPMMPIRGDITMNRIFYPDKEVANSFTQLDMLPAPNGHPVINGVNVSAFHPVATNAHNVGGFVRKPRKKGKRVFVDFVLDTVVANQSAEGKALVERIENGDKIGVSTGLTINELLDETGQDEFGKEFEKVGSGFKFDHVAVLANDETAAGAHAGTELVLNDENGDKITTCTLETNELSVEEIFNGLTEIVRSESMDNEFVWVQEIFPDSKTIIYKVEQQGGKTKMFKRGYAVDSNDEIILLDDKTEVTLKTEFEPVTKTNQKPEGLKMDKETLVLSLIANGTNGFVMADKDRLMGMSESELATAVHTNKEITTDEAKALLTNEGIDFEGYDEFVSNKDDFAAFQEVKKAERDSLISSIVEKTEYTEEMLVNKTNDELDVLSKLVNPKSTDRATPGVAPVTNTTSQSNDCDYSH